MLWKRDDNTGMPTHNPGEAPAQAHSQDDCGEGEGAGVVCDTRYSTHHHAKLNPTRPLADILNSTTYEIDIQYQPTGEAETMGKV